MGWGSIFGAGAGLIGSLLGQRRASKDASRMARYADPFGSQRHKYWGMQNILANRMWQDAMNKGVPGIEDTVGRGYGRGGSHMLEMMRQAGGFDRSPLQWQNTVTPGYGVYGMQGQDWLNQAKRWQAGQGPTQVGARQAPGAMQQDWLRGIRDYSAPEGVEWTGGDVFGRYGGTPEKYLSAAEGELSKRPDMYGKFGRSALGMGERLERLYEDPSYIEELPGYKFAREQGEKAIGRAAAKTGAKNIGGLMAEYSKFNQGLAAQQLGAERQGLLGSMAGYGTQWGRESDIGSQRISDALGLARTGTDAWRAQLQGRGQDVSRYGMDVSDRQATMAHDLRRLGLGASEARAMFGQDLDKYGLDKRDYRAMRGQDLERLLGGGRLAGDYMGREAERQRIDVDRNRFRMEDQMNRWNRIRDMYGMGQGLWGGEQRGQGIDMQRYLTGLQGDQQRYNQMAGLLGQLGGFGGAGINPNASAYGGQLNNANVLGQLGWLYGGALGTGLTNMWGGRGNRWSSQYNRPGEYDPEGYQYNY